MESTPLLKDYQSSEKTAYLNAIASLATADRSASPEEVDYLSALCEKAGLSPEEQQKIIHTAKESNESSLPESLELLKNSELRFPLVADLIGFAESDENYSDEEKKNVEKVAQYLDVNPQQYDALGQFLDQTKQQDVTPEAINQPNFLAGTGIQEKLKSAGIDINSLTKGLLGTIAPLILAKLLGGNRSSRPSNSGMGSGGLGSLISGLGGKTGSSRSGGILGNILSRLL